MSKTAKAKKRITFRAIALILPAAALSLAGCGSSREDELTQELAKAQQELQEAKAAQKAAEKEVEEAREAYARIPTVREDDSEPDDSEDTGDTDESDDSDNQNTQAGPDENPASGDHHTVQE